MGYFVDTVTPEEVLSYLKGLGVKIPDRTWPSGSSMRSLKKSLIFFKRMGGTLLESRFRRGADRKCPPGPAVESAG